MRNIIVHAYFGVDPAALRTTITADLNGLAEAMLAERAYLDSLRP